MVLQFIMTVSSTYVGMTKKGKIILQTPCGCCSPTLHVRLTQWGSYGFLTARRNAKFCICWWKLRSTVMFVAAVCQSRRWRVLGRSVAGQ